MKTEMMISDIEEFCQEYLGQDSYRRHLGASAIGDECLRKVWYSFRWAKKPDFSGRILRLFDRGHLEEPRVVTWLEGIGCEVTAQTEAGSQIRISPEAGGHFGGSVDGTVIVPGKYTHSTLAEKMLLEIKTASQSRFNRMQNYGVQTSDPKYYSQMCVYGYKLDLQRALYVAVNKNNDELYIEIVKLDWNRGKTLIRMAETIVETQTAPRRISEDPSYWICKFCDFRDICHKGEGMLKNCRTCVHSKAVEGGRWYCEHWKALIPEDVELEGCEAWVELDGNS